MNRKFFGSFAMVGFLGMAGCGVETSETVETGKSGPPALDDITLIADADGVMRQVGEDMPFSGVDVETMEEPNGEGGIKAFVVETPYSNGLIDGVKRTYFSGGAIREEREYKEGEPVQVKTYYSDGSKKFAGNLNSIDKVEGPSQRWSKEGVVLVEGSYDENEKHHGVWKEYAEDGKQIGEYLWDHGVIKKIILEEPVQKERRMQHYGEVDPSAEIDAPTGV